MVSCTSSWLFLGFSSGLFPALNGSGSFGLEFRRVHNVIAILYIYQSWETSQCCSGGVLWCFPLNVQISTSPAPTCWQPQNSLPYQAIVKMTSSNVCPGEKGTDPHPAEHAGGPLSHPVVASAGPRWSITSALC